MIAEPVLVQGNRTLIVNNISGGILYILLCPGDEEAKDDLFDFILPDDTSLIYTRESIQDVSFGILSLMSDSSGDVLISSW
jgi:hypothetical protein